MNPISIFGTSSDSGKSTLTFVIGRILQKQGYSVAPFKAQNVSNNSSVCKDGSEIGVAQHFQSEVLDVEPNCHLNPVLLKIEGRGRSQVIVQGRVKETVSPKEYYTKIDQLKPFVKKSFRKLQKKFDIVIAEGAGSPVELNLIERDLANTFIAREFATKIILVADIEKGGVFASIWGTLSLLEPELRENVIGVVINKFRGDLSLFKEGREIIEKQFKVPVLGVVPYTPLNLGFEDSQSLLNYSQNKKKTKLCIAVIDFPKMSNYNDIEPLIADGEIDVEFVKKNRELRVFDLVILPGTKSTIEDLRWLKKSGLFQKIKETKVKLYGICGGYQMFFNNIIDKDGIENSQAIREKGFGFIEDDIVFQKEKILKRDSYTIFNTKVEGFEIHNGISKNHSLFYDGKRVKGSFIHGVFDNDSFRRKIFKNLSNKYEGYNFKKYKKRKIEGFVKVVEKSLDIKRIIDAL